MYLDLCYFSFTKLINNKMKKLSVTYSELRSTTNRMFLLVGKTIGKNKKINLNTTFYQDLEIVGSDWDNFLKEYENEFKCRLVGLCYEDYFKEEITEKDLILAPLRLLTFPLMFLPNKSNIYIKLKEILYTIDKSKGKLTIGDLIVSAIAKEFIKRDNIKLIVKYAR